MSTPRIVKLESITRERHQVVHSYAVDQLRFSTSIWYGELDLVQLGRERGEASLRRLLFHSAVFELNKLCSLRPDLLDLGDYADLWTPALEALWREIFHNVWAQWRYENDDPDYRGPRVIQGATRADAPPIERAGAGADTLLAFCGGGKDSLLMMRLLERAGARYDTLVYSSSIYGPAQLQHQYVSQLTRRCDPGRVLRQWIYDDFMDSPVLELHPELGPRTLTAAETPSSVFNALPLALAHGYRGFCLGHERSADGGQLVWERTGEEVNHQWGKSLAAERLISRYIREQLLADFSYFSPLKPLHDLVIFGMLRDWEGDVPYTHSCNIRKPWCRACPKCLYVWLGYAAFLPREVVRAAVGADDLLARPELVAGFRALMGLDGRQPFECIGGAEEVRVLLGACARRGYEGPTIELFEREVGREEARRLAARYLDVDLEATLLPAELRARLAPLLEVGAASARGYLLAEES
ncbi:MAG: hypothetical protein H6713_36215 [Myxococcales bacterium]|nr:hypothetical protein [Myxococcales bacterium]